MDKDLNRIKAALVKKGGAARLPSVSWRGIQEPISKNKEKSNENPIFLS